jgi:hypothetical protein
VPGSGRSAAIICASSAINSAGAISFATTGLDRLPGALRSVTVNTSRRHEPIRSMRASASQNASGVAKGSKVSISRGGN